jgi:hypothetical protein
MSRSTSCSCGVNRALSLPAEDESSRRSAMLPLFGWLLLGVGSGKGTRVWTARRSPRASLYPCCYRKSALLSSRGIPGVERAGVLGRSTGWSNRAPSAWTVRAGSPLATLSYPARCAARGSLLRQENAAHAARTWWSLHCASSPPTPVCGRGMARWLNVRS